MTTVITYGTFDLLHKGHIRLLQRAASYGDRLIVGLSTDEFNARKGKRAYTKYADRKFMLEAIKYVDLVIPENSWEQKATDIKKYHVDALVMGNDWQGQFDDLKQLTDVIYLPRTDGISTTQIKDDLERSDH
ncbi:glycerol-3-phosphate cytidylyltransferase [Paucilactobacillus wasatchensis]|uniref:Glycerol-3-phosphate cytidylyltransferase n=1 Tax=Paucilactobacillus wasatchensis TaxID=1335616 RepID=A0A0D0YW92_9LACO|nr:glycerol-3-phosphate cytidylyltransferase [Paucilactobacillus wasatchensis]KIS03529.1 Glycerol-3-phosphate cytidylyltransferase [Paucilactobacillus wasatchensis]